MGLIADLASLAFIAEGIARDACATRSAAESGGRSSGAEEQGGEPWVVVAEWLGGISPLFLPPTATQGNIVPEYWGGGRP